MLKLKWIFFSVLLLSNVSYSAPNQTIYELRDKSGAVILSDRVLLNTKITKTYTGQNSTSSNFVKWSSKSK